jgi:GT2 family glycosyltransferase
MTIKDKYSISVIIPTYDRPENVRENLQALGAQSSLPAEVIIVDDGTRSLNRSTVKKILPESIAIHITESMGEPSTSAARNTGVKMATSPIVLFLDDDVRLSNSYIERLLKTYKKHDNTEVAGVGGFDSELRVPSLTERLFNSIFLIPNRGWSINSYGMQSWEHVSAVTPADWLSGNNASYKRSLLLDYPFPHWEGGREALEDIAMGWRLRKAGYRFLIDPELDLTHEDTGMTEGDFSFGVKRGKNRIRIFRTWGNQWFWPLFFWAYLGETLRQFIAPIIDKEIRTHWQIGCGMFVAPFQYVLAVLMSTLRSL